MKEEAYIANSIFSNIDSVLEQSLRTWLSWNWSCAVADLAWVGLHNENLVEGEDTVGLAVLAPLLIIVVLVPGGYGDGGGG